MTYTISPELPASPALPDSQQRWVLASRPHGLPLAENFRLEQAALPSLASGEVLLRHAFLGLAPAARLRMSEVASYAPPLPIGDVMPCQAVGYVVRSNDPRWRVGDQAVAMAGGWQEYSAHPGDSLVRADADLAHSTVWLGALGTSGMTAYVGLREFGLPRPGETVVVSAASGAVGSVAGQMAKLLGCRVVGVAGGAEKCAYVVQELGFDACVDYRAPEFEALLGQACPQGVNVYFENVGGKVRDAVWPLMLRDGRVVLCGLISEYNDAPEAGPGWFPILAKRLHLHGFILSDHLDRRPEFLREMGQWIREGRIHPGREHVYDGIGSAVAGFVAMLQGGHLGKTLVKL